MHPITSWEEWCTIFHRLDFWEEEIRLICAAHGIAVRQIAETYPGTNAVFFVNDDLVLKIYCPFRNNRSEIERRLHAGVLAGQRLYAHIRFHGTSPSGYDYTAFTRVSGTPVRELVGEALPDTAVLELGQVLAVLQRDTLERDAAGTPRCLVHYDLTADHLLVDAEGRLSGIIDFGDAITGHPSDELPALFSAGLQCDDTRITLFCDAYHAVADHYRITDEDLFIALQRHPYCADICAYAQRFGTPFAHKIQTWFGGEYVPAR